MADESFHVELIGHATLRIQSGGRILLTDPWLVDPIGCNSGFHFPPLAHDPVEVGATTDAIYISHIHPDHFNRPTLELFPKNIPVFIGEYRRKNFRDAVKELGFPVIEVPFQEATEICGGQFEITIIEHDYEESAAYDSSIVVRTPLFTAFENNDCFLRADKYHWVRERYSVDYAFLGYSAASFFPICFEFDAEEKRRLLERAADRRYTDFLEAARWLAAKLAIPFASGARFLHEAALWKNVSFNSAAEAVRRLTAIGMRGEVMGPGDRIESDGSIRRMSKALDTHEELTAIEQYAHRVQDWVAGLQRREPSARPDLITRFRNYILDLWRRTHDQIPGVCEYVIAYVLLEAPPASPHWRSGGEARFYFDFSKPDGEVFCWGDPPRYDMRYTYAAPALQLKLDGEIDWDELHFTNAVSVHQVRYAKEFYMMLRSEMLDLNSPRCS